MLTPAIEKPVIYFKPGDRAQLVHLPHRSGPEVIIPALVREVLRDGYVVDTDNQKGVKVRMKDLKQTLI